MTYEYELNKQDYIDFNLNHINTSPTLKRSVMIRRFITPLIFFIFPPIFANTSDISVMEWYIVYTIVYILWAIFYPKQVKRRVINRTTKLLNEGNADDNFGKHIFKITEDGVVEFTKNNEFKCKRIENILETDQHIFIYINPHVAYIFPVRVFESSDEKENFLKELERFKIGKS